MYIHYCTLKSPVALATIFVQSRDIWSTIWKTSQRGDYDINTDDQVDDMISYQPPLFIS